MIRREKERRELLDAAKAIQGAAKAEDRELTESEAQKVDANLDRIDEIDAEIRRFRAGCGRPLPGSDPMAGIVRPYDPYDSPNVRPSKPPAIGATYRAMFGDQLNSGGFDNLEGFLRTVHLGLADHRLMAASTGGGLASGGFLVPTQFSAELLDGAIENEIVRPRARIVPMTTDTRKIAGFDASDNSAGALFGGFTGQWLAESQAATEQDPKTRNVELVAKKLAIFTSASNELVADGLSFEQMLGDALRSAIAWHLDNAFLNGSGAGQPLGVLNDPALVTVAEESGQAAATVVYRNLTNMFSRLHPRSVQNSVWVSSQSAIPQLLELVVPTGSGEFIRALREDGNGFNLLTRPVVFTEKLPTLGSKGDILLVDFTQYVIGLRADVVLERSVDAGWSNDLTKYRAKVRIDGQGLWNQAFKPRNGSSQSWAVTLAART